MPNGSKSVVTHIGSIKLLKSLTLHNVLSVLAFSFNLMSIIQLTKSKQYSLAFNHDSYVI